MSRQFVSILLGLTYFCFALQAQVLINEYSASNLDSFQDNYGKTEDWIELYNNSDTTIDLSGWHLSDKEAKPGKWDIPEGTVMAPYTFLLFWCSGRDTLIGDDYHTNFKLSQTKGTDIVLFSDPTETVLEMHPLNITLVEHSNCRAIDGGSEWRFSTEPSPGSSNIGTGQFTRYTQSPTIDLPAGFYQGTQLVHIENEEPNSTMRYTLDGTNPTPLSQAYTGPIIVSETTVIKAQSYSDFQDILPGKMNFSTYFIDVDYSLPVFSVAADDLIELAEGEGSLLPIGSLEYFDTSKERKAVAFGRLNRHGQDSWILPHRSLDYFCRDEMGYEKAVNYPIFSYSERDEYQKFMFRNSGDDNYPANDDANHVGSTHIRDEYVQELSRTGDMKLDTRAVERVVVYLNGQYWGVYGMRERPVDHDYTKEYYDQGKYDIYYLSTWGTTEAEYGGLAALNDWVEIRDFILNNDMSIDSNYDYAKSRIRMISLADYMLANLNTVAADWLNYNTGWWRGLDPEGDHKKWGYILWDLDATFDYYINYTGIPNRDPDAAPCDLEDIADYMDDFFGGGGGFNPNTCATIIDGSSPYPATDPIFVAVAEQDGYCCDNDWDGQCQDLYNEILAAGGPVETEVCPSILNGSCPYQAGDLALEEVMEQQISCCNDWTVACEERYHLLSVAWGGAVGGNWGQHEKIFLKMLEESETFRQLYFSRQADLMNTVYSCDNMIALLDTMLADIEPEMPRQIDRWGGTLTEWEENVESLKEFILARCTLLDEGMIDCYDLAGPYPLTLKMEPEGVGQIKMNTIDISSSPWTGEYFGNMENFLEAELLEEFEGQYVFTGWQIESSTDLLPSSDSTQVSVVLDQPEVITAVFESVSSIEDAGSGIAASLYPNPASDLINLSYSLEMAGDIRIALQNVLGQEVHIFPAASGYRTSGQHSVQLDISSFNMPAGLYFVSLHVGEQQQLLKLAIR